MDLNSGIVFLNCLLHLSLKYAIFLSQYHEQSFHASYSICWHFNLYFWVMHGSSEFSSQTHLFLLALSWMRTDLPNSALVTTVSHMWKSNFFNKHSKIVVPLPVSSKLYSSADISQTFAICVSFSQIFAKPNTSYNDIYLVFLFATH